jgi:hypothetical protein
MMNKIHIVLLIALLFLFNACYKKNIQPTNTFGTYHPEFSIPIGTPDLNLEQYLQLVRLIPVPDPAAVPDSLIMNYEDQFWEKPYMLEYSIDQRFNLSMENSDSPVSSLMFRVNARNYIPAQIELQVYFVVDEVFVLDSLYSNRLVLNAAGIDNRGVVTHSFELYEKDAFIDERKLGLFNQVTSLRIYTRLIIDDIEGIDPKYYSDQSLLMQFAARVQLYINLDE